MPTTKHRTFGTWLAAYKGTDRIADLRDDFIQDIRDDDLKPSQFKTPFDLYHRIECKACSAALDTLAEAAIAYGQPLPDQQELERQVYIADLHKVYADNPERLSFFLAQA